MIKKRSKLQRYINMRLGNTTEIEQLKAMFKKSFQANSFREFWWYWNPIYNYFLTKYIYRPARKIFPQSIAMLITFLASGFLLHDLPIVILVLVTSGFLLPFPTTIAFMILGLTVIISEKNKLNFSKLQPKNRIFIHLATIIISFTVALIIISILLIKYKNFLMLMAFQN